MSAPIKVLVTLDLDPVDDVHRVKLTVQAATQAVLVVVVDNTKMASQAVQSDYCDVAVSESVFAETVFDKAAILVQNGKVDIKKLTKELTVCHH